MRDTRYLSPLFRIMIPTIIFSGLSSGIAMAISPSDEPFYQVTRTDETIKIDGVLSEPIWNKVPVTDGFWMSYPVDDRAVEERLQTKVRMTSDEQNLYIAAVCYSPEKYIIKTLKRDKEFWEGDGFGVVIDPVNEQTNGFAFHINPAGVQAEYLVTGQTGRRREPEPGQSLNGFNVAWDNKWFSEVTTHPDRWIVEIAIPFKTLRFDEDKSSWGINFFRRDAASNTIHTWAPVPIEFFEIELGYTGTLTWDQPPQKAQRNLAIIPYVRGGVAKDYEAGTEADLIYQAGVDAKVPVTSSLNLDLTINPDFSQVEVDEQVINLTLFDIHLPEKRLFFLENSDIFDDFGIPPMRPFFSRKIGLDEEGSPIPILYGARLSGNINQNLRIGVMNLQTRESDGFLPQNYTVASFHQQVLERSVIKGYIQNRDALRSDYPEKSKRIISHEINGRLILDGDTAFPMLNNESEVGYALKFASTAQLRASYNHSIVNLLFLFTFINGEPFPAGIYRYDQAEIGLQSDQRRLFSLMGGVAYGTFYNGKHVQYKQQDPVALPAHVGSLYRLYRQLCGRVLGTQTPGPGDQTELLV